MSLRNSRFFGTCFKIWVGNRVDNWVSVQRIILITENSSQLGYFSLDNNTVLLLLSSKEILKPRFRPMFQNLGLKSYSLDNNKSTMLLSSEK